MSTCSNMTYDEQHEYAQAFAREFKDLVRKFMPQYSVHPNDVAMLARMQDMTSCYSPWIWSE